MSTDETTKKGLPGLFLVVLALTPILAGGNNTWIAGAAVSQFIWFVAVLVCWGWVTISRPAGFRELGRHRPLWPVFAFALWLGVSCAGAEILDLSIRQTLGWLAAMLVGLTALQLRPSRDQIVTIAAVLLGASALVALYGLYQGFVLLPRLAATPGLSPEDLNLLREAQRPFSVFQGANPFGGFMAAVTPLGLLLWVNARSRTVKSLAALALLVVILGLIASFSRGAWLVFLVGLFPMGVMLLRGRARWVTLAALGLLLLSVYLFSHIQVEADGSRGQLRVPLSARMASLFDSLDVSAASRVDYWRTAGRMGLAHPLTGAGLGSFEEVSRLHQSLPNYTRDPHNIWLKLFSETGVLGLLLFVWVTVAAFLSLRVRGKPRGLAPASPWLALSLALLLMHGSLDIDFATPAAVTLFWLWVALLSAPFLSPPSEAGRPVDPVVRVLAATFTILILFGVQFAALFGTLYAEDAQWAVEQGAHAKSGELLDQSLDFWPISPKIHYRRAFVSLTNFKMTRDPADLKTAEKHLDTALRLNPHNPEYLVGRADILAMSGRSAQVVETLKKAAALYPSSIHYQAEYARALSLSGNHAAALFALNSAIRDYGQDYLTYRNPNGIDLLSAHFLRAAILNEQGEWDAAKAAYANIITLCQGEGLVLNSFVSSRPSPITCEEIEKQARSYMERIEEERRKPRRPDGPPVSLPTLPPNLPIRIPGGSP